MPYSIMFARNEAEDIVGAVKEGLHFADDVWVIVDPATTDDTFKILKERFGNNPRVHVELQIKKDFMQDDSYAGKFKDKEGCIAVHWNMTYWINKIVPEGQWWHFIAPDERYATKDYPDVYYHVRRAMEGEFESVAGPDHLFITDEKTGNRFDWCVEFGKAAGLPNHFIKKPAKWEKGLGIHTGYTIPPIEKRYQLPVAHYHFALSKDSRDFGTGARDHSEFRFNDRYRYFNPMGDDWKDLDNYLDNDGNFLAKNISEEKILAPAYKEQLKTRRELTAQKEELVKMKLESARLKRVASWRDGDIKTIEAKIEELEKTL